MLFSFSYHWLSFGARVSLEHPPGFDIHILSGSSFYSSFEAQSFQHPQGFGANVYNYMECLASIHVSSSFGARISLEHYPGS
jgi:hypothetical protein